MKLYGLLVDFNPPCLQQFRAIRFAQRHEHSYNNLISAQERSKLIFLEKLI